MSEPETEQVPEPTKELPGRIKLVDQETIHKICSGQVVLTLAIAVKELVENAVDAGATVVEIKLDDHGLESIEVSDNGSGVAEVDLEALTAKHHTSKIEEFSDLLSVETYGFRGEALSSLCALSDVTIVTRHKDTNVGIKIEVDRCGTIVKRTPCSRTVGTTVTLKKIFAPLPIRRKEFERNVKREFIKMNNLLQAYCLVVKGVRIICSNHTAKSGKSVVLQTNGKQDILENISAIFGARQCTNLIKLKPAFDDIKSLTKESLLEELSTLDDKAIGMQITDDDLNCLKTGEFQFEGYISSCSHGAGRSSKDRQYFYVNSRPCDSKNLSKVVNDIYHRFNAHQFPFVYLNLIMKRSDVDVNLTPEKRSLLLKNEKMILVLLKKALLNTFGNIPAQYKMENVSIASIFKPQPKKERVVEVKKEEIKRETDENPTPTTTSVLPPAKDSDEEDIKLVPMSTAKNFMDVLSQWRRTGDTRGPAPPSRVTGTKRKCMNEIETRTLKMQKIQEFLSQEPPKSHFANYKSDSESDSENSKEPADTTTSPNESFRCIEKINQASKEYDLFASGSSQRLGGGVSGPAKSFLTFLKEKPTAKFEFGSKGLAKKQDSIESIDSLEYSLPSTSAAARALLNSQKKSAQKVLDSDDDDDDDEVPKSIKHKTVKAEVESEDEVHASNLDDDADDRPTSSNVHQGARKHAQSGSENYVLSSKLSSKKAIDSDDDDDDDEVPSTSGVNQKSRMLSQSESDDELLSSKKALKKPGNSANFDDERPTTSRAIHLARKPDSQSESEEDFFKSIKSSKKALDSDDDDDDDDDEEHSENDLKSANISTQKKIILDDSGDEEKTKENDDENLNCMVLKTSVEEILADLERYDKYKAEKRAKDKEKRLRFKSQIKPNENKKAEEELETEIRKTDFARMEIIGQFNKGFIVVKLDDDLFIVDQHATDEKYNFEKLQETTVLQSQPLAVPQQLELTVANEMVLIEHIAVFEKNGFKFQIDENAPQMRKVKLVAKPFSKNWEFGKEDIDELIFMLQDAPPGTMCRPSRVRSMFASRACRKSVMIGSALDEAAMKKLITHMGEIEQPWNCPHGRPTIRHLVNLTMFDDSGSDSDSDSDSDTDSSSTDTDSSEEDT